MNLIMGVIDGGTQRDLAQVEVDICFTFEPRGKGKTMDQIFGERGTTDPNLRRLMQEEADNMVRRRHLLIEQDQTYVFSKDANGAYSWQPARITDKLRDYFSPWFCDVRGLARELF